MPFPSRLVYDGETVTLDLRPHWWYFSRHIVSGVPLLLVVILAFRISDSDIYNVVKWPVVILVLIWSLWLGLKYLQWLRTYFVVTDQRVLYRTGVLARHGVEIPLDRISNINFHQGIWERIIGAGDLEVQSAGEEGDTLFENVRHPDGVQHEIYRQMEGHATHASGADAIGEAVARAVRDQAGHGRAGEDVADKIEQLARLRDEGHITPDEFEQRKNRLLDEL
ncbi:MAG TPA: PH domain-containing protein [Acidimicrobiia bacterium]